MLHENLKSIAATYVELGVVEGFDKVWPDCQHQVQAELEHEAAVDQKKLPRLIKQAEKKVRWYEKFQDYLLEEREKTKKVRMDRWNAFYCWATFIFWWSTTIGEMFLFPYFYRDIFNVPLHIGLCFTPLFPAASLFVKFIKYDDLQEEEKFHFRQVVFRMWVAALAVFIVLFIICRGLILDWQRNANVLSLSGPSSGNDSLLSLEIATMIFGWLWGMLTVIGLAIIHSRFRDPNSRLENIEKEIPINEGCMKEVTEVYTDLLAKLHVVETRKECQIPAAKIYLWNEVHKQHKERKMEKLSKKMEILDEMYPDLPTDGAVSRNGKASAAHLGGALALIIMLLAGTVSSAQDIFFIQDMGRTDVEQEFQGFGHVVLEMPAGATITLFGSDGIQYAQGSIEADAYETKQLRQRQAINEQARAFYQKLQAQPSDMRDYATALADILSRMGSNAILVIQGKPLYRLDPMNWDGRVPSLSWAFNLDSPFGEHSLTPAATKFRAAIVFSPGDFANPNHRAAIQYFWSVLIARLNGELVLFTTDAGAVATLVSGGKVPSTIPQPDITRIPDKEKYGTLRMEGASVLGVQNP